MKSECYYEKDAHTTVIENIEEFVDEEETGSEIKLNISFLKGISEKIVNIQNFISQPQGKVTDLIVYQCPQCCIYGYNLQEKKCFDCNHNPKYHEEIKYKEMSDEEDTSMNIDIS